MPFFEYFFLSLFVLVHNMNDYVHNIKISANYATNFLNWWLLKVIEKIKNKAVLVGEGGAVLSILYMTKAIGKHYRKGYRGYKWDWKTN